MTDLKSITDLEITTDETTGQVSSVRLYGHELLDTDAPCRSELWVNGLPLPLRPHTDPNSTDPQAPERPLAHLKGERWTDHFSGWGLVVKRVIGGRPNLKYPCVGIQTLVRRERCDQTLPLPGPGGPPIEAPLHIDTLGVLNWNWRFWGGSTHLIFPSAHSNGPTGVMGHLGYEDDAPEEVKTYLGNVWRRIYPGVLAIHGGLFYNPETGHWLALTCRRPQVGYILNIENAGRGLSYDFTLHAPFGLGETLQIPEIKIYYGPDKDSMMRWLADYVTFYYEEPPAWVAKTVFGAGLSWNNQPTWAAQADDWEQRIASGELSGIGYSLVTNRPLHSGTTPLGYEPDPNHGTRAEFKTMCRRLADRGVPMLIWMSHSGLLYQGGPDIDDDWFIRGIDGQVCASWGSIDGGGLTHINPGHPGYIAYTKKWLRFYIEECGCKGIFLDCLGWAFPPDFTPRAFMRFPGDTNRMAVKFVDEIYACLKECDPDAVLLGEGALLDAPVNVFSLRANPRRSGNPLGPRDFFLSLNRWSDKKIAIDQGPALFPASGYCTMKAGEEWAAHNCYVTALLRARGGRGVFTALPGDLSVLDDLVFVPVRDEPEAADVRLPKKSGRVLVEEITGTRVVGEDGFFPAVHAGIYRVQP